MTKAWLELFEKNDKKLLSQVYLVYDKAFKQAHAKGDKAVIGADETAEKLEALLQHDFKKYDFLDQEKYQRLLLLVDEWLPDLPPGEEQYKCAAVQQILSAVLKALHQEKCTEALQQYHRACVNYAKTFTEDHLPLKKKLQELAEIAINPKVEAGARVAQFHQELRESKALFASQIYTNKYQTFVNALGVVAASILGFGVGGVVAYRRLFKKEIAHHHFLKELSVNHASFPRKKAR